MTKTEAKSIGSRQGLISVGIGLLIAQSIMTLLNGMAEGFVKGFLWFVDFEYFLNIMVGVVVMLACGHFYGQFAGRLILINKWNYMLTGFMIGVAVIVTTTFFASWVGFIQEGLQYIGTNHDPFQDYIITPLISVSVFGLIPTLIVGIWFGNSIKKKEKHETQHFV